MQVMDHPVDQVVDTITYRGVLIDIVERPEVIWVGCIAYADNNVGPPFPDDDLTLLHRYQSLTSVPKQSLLQPDWSASLSIHYENADRPSGIMFAQETATDLQDARFDVFRQPRGLWMRLRNDAQAARLLGKEDPAPYEYFSESRIMQDAAEANGYSQNPEVHVCVEYFCHAEYETPPANSFAYMPVIKG